MATRSVQNVLICGLMQKKECPEQKKAYKSDEYCLPVHTCHMYKHFLSNKDVTNNFLIANLLKTF